MNPTNQERVVTLTNGWLVLPAAIGLVLGGIALLIYSIVHGVHSDGHPVWSLFALSLCMELVGVLLFPGFFTLQPNEARVLLLFGAYKGTVRHSGMHWGNHFYSNSGRSIGASRMQHFQAR